MKPRNSATLSLLAFALTLFGAGIVPLAAPSAAMANDSCGGLNQRVCKKWEQLRGCDRGLHRTKPIGGICTHDNKLIPDAIEEKLVGFYEPGETDCGGLNQRVCKKNEQLRGCDPGLHRTRPIGGICTEDNKLIPNPIENFGDRLKNRANEIIEGTVAQQQVLKQIATCVAGQRATFKDAVKGKDRNAASQIAFSCVTPQMAQSLRHAPTSGADLEGASSDRFFRTLTIGIGGGAILGIGGNGEAGLVLSLEDRATPKFYSGGGVNVGYGAAAGADVVVGISKDRIESGRNQNLSINASGKYIAGAGISVTFDYANPFKENPFNGISVSGGVGGGFEVGTINPTWSKVH